MNPTAETKQRQQYHTAFISPKSVIITDLKVLEKGRDEEDSLSIYIYPILGKHDEYGRQEEHPTSDT